MMKYQRLGTMNIRDTLMSFADNLWKGAPELPARLRLSDSYTAVEMRSQWPSTR